MDDILIDHPYIAAEETKHWLKLDDLKDASPCDIVLMNNMGVLLHLLQMTLRAQETIILKIDKKSVYNDAKPRAPKIQPKWLKLVHERTSTPAQFVISSNLWQLFQILQSLRQSQDKILDTLDTGYAGEENDVLGNQEGRHSSDPLANITLEERHLSDPLADTTHQGRHLSDPLANATPNAIDYASSDPLGDNAIDYVYEVYNKFLAETGCYPYLTNTASCRTASEAFRGYFKKHEELIKNAEIDPLVQELDNDSARGLFISMSKRHHLAKRKGKRRVDEDMPPKSVLDSQTLHNERSYMNSNKKSCRGQDQHKNGSFVPQDPQNDVPSSPKSNGIPYPASRIQPQLQNNGRELCSGNLREPLKEKKNLPELTMSKNHFQ